MDTREKWTVVFLGLLLGAATVLILVVAGMYIATQGWSHAAAPTRWHPITPTPTPQITPTPTPSPTPTPRPEGLYIGGRAKVVSRVGVRMRKTPGYKGKPANDVVIVVPPNTTLDVIGGPKEVDGLRWWQVRWGKHEGWMAEFSAGGTRLLGPSP